MKKCELIISCLKAVKYSLYGKLVWRFLKRKYSKYKKFVIFPTDDQEYNAWGIIMLKAYFKKEKINEGVVLASNKYINKAIEFLELEGVKFQLLKFQSITCLMNYYALVNMSELWTVISVTVPYNTGAERLLGIKGVTKKEIVYYDIYGFSNSNIEKEIGTMMDKKNLIKEILKE